MSENRTARTDEVPNVRGDLAPKVQNDGGHLPPKVPNVRGDLAPNVRNDGWLSGSVEYARRGREATEHVARADLHRPTDPGALAREIRRQVDSGLKPRDVATALRIDLAVVLGAIREGGGA
jgi:hypothetical protein